MTTQTKDATFLRRSLLLDGIASGATGALALFGAGPVSVLIGLPTPGLLRAIGAGLLVYAAVLLWSGARSPVSRAIAVAAVVLNTGWVVGSVAVIEVGILTTLGNVAVAAVAAAVLVFALLQVIGLKRLRVA